MCVWGGGGGGGDHVYVFIIQRELGGDGERARNGGERKEGGIESGRYELTNTDNSEFKGADS